MYSTCPIVIITTTCPVHHIPSLSTSTFIRFYSEGVVVSIMALERLQSATALSKLGCGQFLCSTILEFIKNDNLLLLICDVDIFVGD
nr:hypothetical protein HmN_000609300 [Hymenolepis microstoma]